MFLCWYIFYRILEYVDISNLKSIDEIKKALLRREQFYLNIINPSLNRCKIAGSSSGIKHNMSFSKHLSEARRGKKYKVNKLKIKN